VVWLGITVIAFPVAALGSGDTDWIRSLAWMIPGITLCSVTIPAEVMCYYYLPDSVRISYVNHMVPAKKPNAYSITILHQYGTAYN